MNHNKALKVLFLYNSIFVLAGAMIVPIYALYVQKIRNDVLPVSLTWAAFMFSATLFTWAVSRFGDRVKKKEYLLLGGYAVRAIVWPLFIFAGDVLMLVFLQVLLGIGEALGSPSFDAIFADHLNKSEEVCEYSTWKLISNVVTATGTVLGGLIVERFGFPSLFILMSFLAIASFAGLWFKPRNLL